MKTYKQQVEELQEMVIRLEKGDLSINELVQLEELTRKLHERSVILKYKAFESKVKPTEVEEEVEEPIAEVEEEVIEEKEGLFDLSIFETEVTTETSSVIEEEPVAEIEPEIEVVPEPEAIIEEEVEEPVDEVIEDEEDEVVEVQSTSNGNSFFDKINLSDNSLAGQFTGGKLETLIGVFGLNERLRFINNLFDGSSESFSESVKKLDGQHSFDEAKIVAEDMAQEHDWDVEDENVIEFMTYVKRRYA